MASEVWGVGVPAQCTSIDHLMAVTSCISRGSCLKGGDDDQRVGWGPGVELDFKGPNGPTLRFSWSL